MTSKQKTQMQDEAIKAANAAYAKTYDAHKDHGDSDSRAHEFAMRAYRNAKIHSLETACAEIAYRLSPARS